MRGSAFAARPYSRLAFGDRGTRRSFPGRRALTGFLAVGCLLAAPAAQAADSDRAAAAKRARTEQKTFSAFDAGGEPTVRIERTRTADSCSGSYINQQPTALRCFAGNSIYDPCFEDPADDDAAVCIASPHSRSGIRLRGIGNADDGTRNDGRGRMPWAVDLRRGQQCTFASGATGGRGERRLNFICDDGSFLWGSPRRSTRFWTILRSKTYEGRWKRVQIAVAWK